MDRLRVMRFISVLVLHGRDSGMEELCEMTEKDLSRSTLVCKQLLMTTSHPDSNLCAAKLYILFVG